jgi:methionine-rich copper-binding protein CopC
MSRLTRILTVTALVSIALAGQAFAHAHLKNSAPADKAAVASPSELDLTFTEELTLKFSGITITGPDKTEIKLGDAMLEDGGKVLMVPVSDKLAPGSYTVDWHVLSTDGHKTNGTFSFTVKPL